MIGLYILTAIIGGGLVVVSAFFGHGEHGVDHSSDFGGGDAHIDHDASVDHGGHETHGDAHLWIPFLSLRFWTYFLASFGLIGILLTYWTELREPAVGGLAGGSGFALGLFVAYLMRIGQRLEAGTHARSEDFLGMTGTVMVAVRPGSVGKIRVNIKGDLIELLAIPNEDESLDIGDEAVIVTFEKDRARVMSRSALLEETHVNV